MITKHSCRITLALLACAGAFLCAPAGYAQTASYQISLNTAALMGNSAGPFSLDFQLTDGSGLGDGNNIATLSNFSFGGGGAPFGSANLSGNVTGSLATGVSLTDSTFFNEFYQSFAAGSTLSFQLTLTTSPDAGGTPDAFSLAILDQNLANITTTSPGDTLLFVNIDGPNPVIETGSGRGSFAGVTVTSVPEPTSLALLALGLGALLARARKSSPGV